MLLLIDNYDSFTHNIARYFNDLGAMVNVIANDAAAIDDIAVLNPNRIVISPGPGTPQDAGISINVIRHFKGRVPILGVCLGHQAINEAFGGQTVHAKDVMHGKVSLIHHTDDGIFAGIPRSFEATRYHSLVINQNTLPDSLKITAWTQNEIGDKVEIMGIRHRDFPIEGVQFHPESVLSQHGYQLFENFLKL